MEKPEVTDVLVIGAGFAGLAAAIEARRAGSSVIVLEKMRAPGGNSIISDGGIAAAGTPLQSKLGIVDSPEIMAADMLRAGLGLNHPELVRVLAEKSDETLRWSAEYLGVEYMDRLDRFGGHSVARCYTPVGKTGAAIIRREVLKIDELGIDLRTQTRFESFIRNENGRVVGVTLREGYDHRQPQAGSVKSIHARRGVILASGGFGADVAFREAQDPRLGSAVDTTNKPFATAEGLTQALMLGANPVQLSHIQLGPWASPDEQGYGEVPGFADYIVFQYGIIVHPKTGKRLVNELGDRKTVADAILAAGEPCLGIADSEAVKKSGWSIEHGLKKGVIKSFDQLEALGAYYGTACQELEIEVNRFNRFIENGTDEDFGKPLLSGALPLSHPPYYAVRLWPKVHYTMGGVQIDTGARVIDLRQQPVAGLYAAGEVTGGIHGACRLGSCSITDCLVFGRIAGRNCAAESMWC